MRSQIKLHILLLIAFSFSVSAHSQSIPDAQKILIQRGEVYFQFVPADFEVLDQIARVISVDEYDPQTGIATAYANKQGFERFLSFKLDFELLNAPGLAAHKSQFNMLNEVDVSTIDAWDFYPTYEAYESMMEQFEELFPHLYERIEILTLPSGRKLIFGRITADVEEENERPKFMYTSTMHGDETTGFNLMLRMIHYLLNGYGEDEEITWLLDNLEIWICPNENPDGTYTTNNNTITGATRGNASFIDLNRNYPNPVLVPEPDMQPETEAMIQLVQSYPFVLSANIHGGIECVNYPWDSWKSWEKTHADHYWWQYVMHEYADTARYYSPSGYMDPWGPSFNNGVTHGGDWYVIYGSRQDYMNYYAHLREFTLEISNTKLLPTSQLNDLWNYNYRSLLNYMKQSLFGIRGRVTDALTGEPVVARIHLTGYDTHNSHVYSHAVHGTFNRPLKEGTYDLLVSADGYPDKFIPCIEVLNHHTTWLDIEMGIEASIVIVDQGKVVLFPNPAGDRFTLQNLTGNEYIRVLDLSGKVIKEKNASSTSAVIPVVSLAPSLYIVEIRSSHQTIRKKLQVIR